MPDECVDDYEVPVPAAAGAGSPCRSQYLMTPTGTVSMQNPGFDAGTAATLFSMRAWLTHKFDV